MVDELLVVRAGVTDYELSGRLRGTLDMPLAAAGRAWMERIATELAFAPPQAVLHAADGPSRESAALIAAAADVRPREVAGMVNLDQGLWQGMLIDDIRVKQPRLHRQWQDNPWSVAPPEGELLEEACERVEAALERMFKRHPAGRVAVVVPRPLDAVVTWLVSGRSMGDLWRFDADAELATMLPVAAQWRPSRPGVAVASADRLAPTDSLPVVSR